MKTARIIIVEDERIIAFNLRQRLIKLGYEVPAIAANGGKALEAIENEHPDLVLMDIHIEGEMDGIDTAAEALKRFQVPVIYLTAYSEDATLARARQTRPYGFLLKPFSERELHATIQMALERAEVERALDASQSRLRMALSAANMTDWELLYSSTQGEVLYAGQADFLQGFADRSFSGSRAEFMQLVEPAFHQQVNAELDRCINEDPCCDIEFAAISRGSDPCWLRLQGKLVTGQEPLQIIGLLQNITERKLAERGLLEAATVFEAIQDGILILDASGKVVNINSSFARLSGYQLADLQGLSPAFFDESALRPEHFQRLQTVMRNGGHWRAELSLTDREGRRLPALVAVASVAPPNQPISHFVVVVTDLSPIRSAEKKLEYLAHHDPLTGLPNRLLTLERLNQALLRAKRHRERIAVLFIDLDHFKWVNDSLGHDAGDRLLTVVAERMRGILRQDDTLGRLGGDEFLIVLDPVENEQSAVTVVDKLADEVTRSLEISGHTIEVSCSIGVSFFPEDGNESSSLIRAADTAMYAAKEAGRNGYAFFTPGMTDKAVRYLALNHDLHRGFKAREMILHYQALVQAESQTLAGLEALIRWQHPLRGLVSPIDIIPLAEENGMIVAIGEWVLEETCRQLRSWLDQGFAPPPISINVSPTQFVHGDFVRVLETLLARYQLSPDYLEIEVTENVLQSGKNVLNTLQQLRALGVSIAIDDFGTGFSSLSSLKLLPIHRLKIDRAFVTGVPADENDTALTEVIISIARTLKLQITAEGVETPDQATFLKEHGCNVLQGYHFHRPCEAQAVERLLSRKHVGDKSLF
ncbi:MAG: EAL domain-containing protein [Hahellaceae bacterium]|nr:EAL domain-containing protein [Hahellaceae bacterium]